MKFLLLIASLGYHSVVSHRLGDDDGQEAFQLLDSGRLGRKDSQELSAEVDSDVNHTGVLKIRSDEKKLPEWLKQMAAVGGKLRSMTGQVTQIIGEEALSSAGKIRAWFQKHHKAIYAVEKLAVGITLLSITIACPACAGAALLGVGLGFAVAHAVIDASYNIMDPDMSAGEVAGAFVFSLAIGAASQLLAFGVLELPLSDAAAATWDMIEGICGCVGDAVAVGTDIRDDLSENVRKAKEEGGEGEFAPIQRRNAMVGDELKLLTRSLDVDPRPVQPQRRNAMVGDELKLLTSSIDPSGQLPLDANKKPKQNIMDAFTAAGIAAAIDAAGFFTCSGVTMAKESR